MFQSVHRVLVEPYTVCHMIRTQMSRGQFLKHATLGLNLQIRVETLEPMSMLAISVNNL